MSKLIRVLVEGMFSEVKMLLEYDASKTWSNYGSKVLSVMYRDGSIPVRIKNGTEEDQRDYFLDCIVKSDPTKHQEYGQWLVKLYSGGGIKLEDLMSRVADAVQRFNLLKLKKKLEPSDRDINRYKTLDAFESMLGKYQDTDLTSGKDIKKSEADVARGESRVYYDGSDVRVIVPEDIDSAKYYGRGTKWCTAADKNNMYYKYAEHGDLYIIIPKKPAYAGEKYQLQFETEQVMNEQDVAVRPFKLLARFPELQGVFSEQIAKSKRASWKENAPELYQQMAKELVAVGAKYIAPEVIVFDTSNKKALNLLLNKFISSFEGDKDTTGIYFGNYSTSINVVYIDMSNYHAYTQSMTSPLKINDTEWHKDISIDEMIDKFPQQSKSASSKVHEITKLLQQMKDYAYAKRYPVLPWQIRSIATKIANIVGGDVDTLQSKVDAAWHRVEKDIRRGFEPVGYSKEDGYE
jgi:hypothetical protein